MTWDGLLSPRQTHADVAVPVVRVVAVAKRRAAVACTVEPTAAAQHPEWVTTRCFPRAVVGRSTGVIDVPIVLAPFPHIAAHVVEAKLIRKFQTY